MQLLYIDLRAELDHMSESHRLFSISDEESFCHKRCIFIEYLRFKQAMEVSSLVIGF